MLACFSFDGASIAQEESQNNHTIQVLFIMFKIAGCHTEGHGDFLYGRGIDGRQCPLCRRPDQGVRRRVFIKAGYVIRAEKAGTTEKGK